LQGNSSRLAPGAPAPRGLGIAARILQLDWRVLKTAAMATSSKNSFYLILSLLNFKLKFKY
jgi:hypothetical protein